jgi:hypothetical protein
VIEVHSPVYVNLVICASARYTLSKVLSQVQSSASNALNHSMLEPRNICSVFIEIIGDKK